MNGRGNRFGSCTGVSAMVIASHFTADWRVALFGVVLTLWAGMSMIAFAQDSATQSAVPDFGATQSDVPDVGIDQRLDAQIPLDLTFADETGKTVKLGDYFDGKRAVVLSLVYFGCPMMCTEVLNGMVDALKKLPFNMGEKFTVLTVSFDPGDTPALAAQKKKNYIDAYAKPGGVEGWRFLTGRPESITPLAGSVGFRYAYDKQTGQFAHASGIMVLTPKGRVSHYLFGIEYPPEDLRRAIEDASQSRIGSAVEQLLMLCYQYDPNTGRYNLVVGRVVQIAGGGTVLIIAMTVGFLFRSERRKRRSAGT